MLVNYRSFGYPYTDRQIDPPVLHIALLGDAARIWASMEAVEFVRVHPPHAPSNHLVAVVCCSRLSDGAFRFCRRAMLVMALFSAGKWMWGHVQRKESRREGSNMPVLLLASE